MKCQSLFSGKKLKKKKRTTYSEEANWSGSALLAIKYVNFYKKNAGSSNMIGWLLEVGVA